MSGTYPVAIRSLLKGVPCIVMCMSASTLFWLVNYAFIRHPHDHAPRFSYRSTRFGLYIRNRDDQNREEFQQYLNYNPNQKMTLDPARSTYVG